MGFPPWSARAAPPPRSAPGRRSGSTAPRAPSPCFPTRRVVRTEYTRPLDRLSRADEPECGGKSSNLGELLAAEIPVPPGFGIATAAYLAFVHDAGLEDRISSALAGVTAGDVDAIGRASHAISEAMRFAPVPQAVREEIADGYAQLGDDPPPVAVRSSAG